jgi:hypothetical protein
LAARLTRVAFQEGKIMYDPEVFGTVFDNKNDAS